MPNLKRCIILPVVSCLLILLLPLQAYTRLELTYLRGELQSPAETNRASTRQYEYLQELPRPFAFSISYLNEGHLDEPDKHHRDGFVFQAWVGRPLLVLWLSLSAGIGPYYWYDTQRDSTGSDKYVRGFAFIGAVAAKVQLPWDGLFLQARFNRVEANNNIDTNSVLLGIGTDFSSEGTVDESLPDVFENDKNEVLFLFNTFHDNGIMAAEYRGNLGILGGHIEVSATYYLKNDTISDGYRSYGAAGQIWAVNTLGDRLKFGFGAGLFLDLYCSDNDVSDIVSFLVAFRISNHWNIQACHSRILHNERYDEDIRTVAVGCLF